MMTPDEIRKYCVIVNDGSGCIFQPLDGQHTYILTAKHVIENSGTQINQLVRFENGDKTILEIEIFHDPLALGVNYFPHVNIDAAIIKVPKIPGLDRIIRQDVIDNENQEFTLIGYPNIRRNDPNRANWVRINDKVRIMQTKADGLLEARLDAGVPYAEIVGQSGGCYVRTSGGYLNLIGIQNRVSTSEQEFQGRVDFTPLSFFDDIVAANPIELSDLLPPYLRCFSFLQEEAFDINGGFADNDIAFARKYLREKTQDVIDSATTPRAIKNHFKERLLVYSCDVTVLQSKALWLCWLEFLTIIRIARDQNLEEDNLEAIFDSVRVLHSDTETDWAGQIWNIMHSDYKGLRDDGLVLISVAKDPAQDGEYVIKKGTAVPNITQAKKDMHKGKMNIDRGRTNPFDHFTIAHINCFKKLAIVLKAKDYSAIDDEQVLHNKLKEEFNELLKS